MKPGQERPEQAAGREYRVEPDALETRVAALTELTKTTGDLLASASRLAERLPMLGTAPPAVHLAERLREAAGRSGLTGEVDAADTELNSFREALSDTVTAYRDGETDVQWLLRVAEDTTADTVT